MGKSSGSTTTSTNAPPPDVTAQYDKLLAQANAQSAQPLQQYNAGTNASNIVAPLNATQNQAATEVANAQGASQPLYNQAQGLIQNASKQITPQMVNAADIQQYQNPYTQQVINSTMANINQQDAGQQSQLAGNAASSGAFGGDRQAVAQALLANQQDLANNQTIAGLENQSYSQALGEANTQQQAGLSAQEASQYLGQQGAQGLTNLGNTEQNAALTGAAALNSVGNQQQTETQAQLNVPYEQFQQAQAFPYQDLSWLSSLSTGLGSGLGGTSTTTQPAPNSLFARGGHIEGLIKKLASGGAIMMPAHYDRGGLIKRDVGGIIPGQTNDSSFNSGIPNIDESVFSGAPVNLTKGVGIPQAPKPQPQPDMMQQLQSGFGLANSLKGLIPSSGGSSASSSGIAGNPLNLSSGSNFTPSDLSSISADFGNTGVDTAASSASDAAPAFFSTIMEAFKKGGTVPDKYAFGGNVLPDVVSGVGDVVGAFFGDPAAGSQFTGALSQIDGGETKPGLQLSSLFNSGGLVKHYDDGGLVPFDTSTNPMANNMSSNFAQMSQQQLEEALPRIQNPQQKMLAQKVLQQKQVMPNTSNGSSMAPAAPTAPQAAMARGGLIKKFADGGGDDDYLSQLTDPSNASSAPNDLPSTGLLSADPSLAPVSANATPPVDSPQGLVKPSAPTPDSNGFTPIPMPQFHDDKPVNEVSPWLSVAAGVAGALSGRSPYVLQNLAGGLESGLNNYGQQKKEAAEETYKAGTIQDARDQMIREAQQYNATGQQNAKKLNADIQNQMAERQQAATNSGNTATYQQAEIANMEAQRKIQQQIADQGRFTPVKDVYGNVTGALDQKTGKAVPISNLGINTPQSQQPPNGAPPSSSPATDPQAAGLEILAEQGTPFVPAATRQDISGRNAQATEYRKAATAAKQVLDASNALDAQTGKYTPGGAMGAAYGAASYVGKGGPETTARTEADKQSKLLANAVMKANTTGNGTGIRMVQFDAGAVPNADMTDNARTDLINENKATANLQVQRAVISDLYPRYSVANVNSIMDNYEQKNPARTPDGKANPNWMPYQDWVKAGRPSTLTDIPASSKPSAAPKSINWVIQNGILVQAP